MQRTFQSNMRFEGMAGAPRRTVPPPNLPEGPSHKLATNYYYSRDGRRESSPPVLLGGSIVKRIEAGKSAEKKDKALMKKGKKVPTPRSLYHP
ncbi:unnamed protein product [Darwinula stevensoni]|uniref:NADH dehydrogenase [ubiquinone] 1 alpha subcomplex subunit 7 n=1 Tax=Darwinula stevensoni TaxID=69355 RepID=A0A7R9AB17_9CRUS|nr:unnamed protein product [Darwinula stevensoni]CAG0898852.1 unnamed protein product [Darwinula stevensoni]